MYEEGNTIAEVSRITSVNINTTKTIISRYKKNDCEIVELPRGSKSQKKLSPQILEQIETIVESEPGITLKNIRKKLFEQFNVMLALSTIFNGLKELKITLKMASIEMDRMNSASAIENRRQYASQFAIWSPQQKEKMIFIDEYGFNLHLSVHKSQEIRYIVKVH